MKKMILFFVTLQIPLFLFVIFKDHILFTLIYIGIFSITLIFYRRLLVKCARITYANCHLRVLDHLILLLKSGKSAQSSLKIVVNAFTRWEKLVFSELESIFEVKQNQNAENFAVNAIFFEEIKIILRSNHQVSDQIKNFRAGLKIRHNLRHKSRQVTQQIRAQAFVAMFIFALLLVTGFKYLNLGDSIDIVIIATLLFVVGLVLIFVFGGKIRWKT